MLCDNSGDETGREDMEKMEGELTSFSFPIMSPISFSLAALMSGGSEASAFCTILLSAAGRLGSCARSL